MAEELIPQASSQPAPDASVSAGTNAVGKTSEPVAQPSMTPSQQADYYNKTQQLAQQRRELEAQRAQFEQERQGFFRQNGFPQQQPQGQGWGQPTTGYPQPSYPPLQAPQLPIDPQVYARLVEQFGKEGADAQVQAIMQTTGSVQQQLAEARQLALQAQYSAAEQSVNIKGERLYGEEWKIHGPKVMEFIIRANGVPLEQAWYAVRGPELIQQGRDAAYQAQQQKAEANVAQKSVQPANTQLGNIGSFEDAFSSAVAQYNG